MSKLYSAYLSLKKENEKKLYLFKSGIFLIALDDDALALAKQFNFKLTNLNDAVIKCGFPISRMDYYTHVLKESNVNFEIIDLAYNRIENYSDYLNNAKLKSIIDELLNIDMDNISFKDSFYLLQNTRDELKKIYS